MNLEHERRFYISPKQFSRLQLKSFNMDIDEIVVERIDITQGYLINKDKSLRVRNKQNFCHPEKSIYTLEEKIKVDKTTSKEVESIISKETFDMLMRFVGKIFIKKERYTFLFSKYPNLKFDLDVFRGRLDSLVILEVELEKPDDIIVFPPELDVSMHEITDYLDVSNRSLALGKRDIKYIHENLSNLF